jgi:hypothetical protein
MMMTVLTLLMESAEITIFSLIKPLVKYHIASSPEDPAIGSFSVLPACSTFAHFLSLYKTPSFANW